MIELLYKLYENHSVEELLHFANIHSISCMMYDSVGNDDHEKSLEIKNFLRMKATVMGIRMQQKNAEALMIIEKLNNSCIDYCVIKGIILQSYYKKPHYRYMGDLDIWVQESNIDQVVEVLKSNGYIVTHQESQDKHIVMDKSNSLRIEIHFQLVEPWSINAYKEINDQYWLNRCTKKIGEVSVPTLEIKYHYKYLIFHKVAHICFSGFGIKQLLDLVVIVNSKDVNPVEHLDYFDDLGYGVFYRYLIVFCVKYLDMNFELDDNFEYDEEILERLFESIIKSGAFGNHSESIRRVRDKRYKYKTYYKNKFMPLWWYSLFPIRAELGPRYSYAKNNILLLPIAWIHRLIRGANKENITFRSKVNYIVKKENINERDELLGLLGIDF